MKSPGISFVGIDISSYKNKIKSQLELLLEFSNVYTIGITGTKGKKYNKFTYLYCFKRTRD